MKDFRHKDGFTLIELLVVVAIISLLSSVVMTATSSARVKARKVAFKQQLQQMVTLLQLEYSETGRYTNLQTTTYPGWASSRVIAPDRYTCDTLYNVTTNPSNYDAQANAICKKVVELSGVDGYSFYVHADSTSSNYSVQGYIYVPTELRYCIGSTGQTNGITYASDTAYAAPGCSGSF